MSRGRPTPGSLGDLCKCAIHFGVELEGCIRTALQVPIEPGIVFSNCVVMKFDGEVSGHREAWLNCACVLLPTKWSLHDRNPVPLFASRFQHPKQLVLPLQPCLRGLKLANPPMPLAPRQIETAPAPATWKLPKSFVPYKPHLKPILSRDTSSDSAMVIRGAIQIRLLLRSWRLFLWKLRGLRFCFRKPRVL
jgi:hypothetical protein